VVLALSSEADSAAISAAGKVWGGSCVSEVLAGFGASFEGIPNRRCCPT